MRRIVIAAVFAFALLSGPAFSEEKAVSGSERDAGFKFRTDPKIKQARPKKPLKIDLKRHEDGTYTWEISGGSAEEVLEADEELRKKLGVK